MSFEAILTPGVSHPPTATSASAVIVPKGRVLHIAGQPPRDENFQNAHVGDVEGQAHTVMRRIKAIVEYNGATMDDVFKLTMYYTNREHLNRILDVRKTYFRQAPYPAATAAIVQLNHPDWLLEISAEVLLPNAS